jgi:hypothetical protein
MSLEHLGEVHRRRRGRGFDSRGTIFCQFQILGCSAKPFAGPSYDFKVTVEWPKQKLGWVFSLNKALMMRLLELINCSGSQGPS